MRRARSGVDALLESSRRQVRGHGRGSDQVVEQLLIAADKIDLRIQIAINVLDGPVFSGGATPTSRLR